MNCMLAVVGCLVGWLGERGLKGFRRIKELASVVKLEFVLKRVALID